MLCESPLSRLLEQPSWNSGESVGPRKPWTFGMLHADVRWEADPRRGG